MKIKTINDTVTITRYGDDDFDIFWHNGDCSVRGTATDILDEFCDGKLSEIKELAYKMWSEKPENPEVYVEAKGMALCNPWIDTSARFPLNDADAIKEWGMREVFTFCNKAKEVI